jgi:hypothetical protein
MYHMQGFGHHDGMLLGYLPKEPVLHEADGHNPQTANAVAPDPPTPITVSLLDSIRRLKRADRVTARRCYGWAVVAFFAASSALRTSTAFSTCMSRPFRKSPGRLSTYTSGGTP